MPDEDIEYRYLTDSNRDRIGLYFDEGETFLTIEELKQRKLNRHFLYKLHSAVERIHKEYVDPR